MTLNFNMIASEILRIDAAAIPPETPLIRIQGWDSLKFLRIIVTVEKQLSVRFDVAEVTRLVTWGELKALVAQYGRV